MARRVLLGARTSTLVRQPWDAVPPVVAACVKILPASAAVPKPALKLPGEFAIDLE